MIPATDDSPFRSLFSHTLRKEWGVGVLAGEIDGKRRYLFENGVERTLADGFYQMMHRVDKPNPDQQAAYTRLRGILSKRDGDASGRKTNGENFLEQFTRFRETYPAGLLDAKWATVARGDGAEQRAPRHRQPLVREAKERLTLQALDSFLSSQQFAKVWDQLIAVLRQSDLVPAAQFKLKTVEGDQQRTLAVAVRELLYGNASYDLRFDRYLAAFVGAFGQHPRWELATAPSAIVHPGEHVCVEPTAFRKQLKLTGSSRSIATQPSSAGYTTFLASTRMITNKLTEQGQAPRDLLDVRDFIVFTLKPAPKARVTREKAKPAARNDDAAETEMEAADEG